MDAQVQISAVVKCYEIGGRTAVDAVSLTVPPGGAVAVTGPSRGVVLAALRQNRLNVSDARCEALFASWLQPSDAPTAERVGEAVNCTVRRFGIRGCAGRMAQEFGDHPEAAAERMRWVRRLAAEAPARPQPNSGPSHPACRSVGEDSHRPA